MVKRVQWIGHITADANEFIGRQREITVDVTTNEIRVHDGATAGGHRVLPKELNDALYMPIGQADFTGILTVDTINEHTGNAGVTIDGVLIKDGEVDGVDISVLETEVLTNIPADIAVVQADIDGHQALTNNPHAVTKTQVGLANVTNDAQLKIASNLADLANAATARSNLGLGTAATLNVGTGPNNVVQLDGSSKLPAVDGSQLTNISGFQTGMVMAYLGATALAGWIFMWGTIGSAASGATNRANADTSALYTLIWNSFADTEAPVSGGRGASAAADFSANKTIAVPDMRGRTIVGKDNMGGTSANRLTGASGGVNGDTMGASGGSESHTLIENEIAPHTHDYTRRLNATGFGTTAVAYSSATGTTGTSSVTTTGGGAAHNNVQPSLVLPYMVKL